VAKRKGRKNKRAGKQGKGRKKTKPTNSRKPARRHQRIALGIDYYWRPFALLHNDLAQSGFRLPESHTHRQAFWALVPPAFYEPLQARPLLLAYASSLGARIGPLLSGASLGYWLHLYRRLSPSPIGG
jgi:hypothetical protein